MRTGSWGSSNAGLWKTDADVGFLQRRADKAGTGAATLPGDRAAPTPGPPAPLGAERRVEPRFTVAEPVTVAAVVARSAVTTYGRCVDLSRSGGRLTLTDQKAMTGANAVAVVFDDWTLAILARVINIGERGLALAFLPMTEDQKATMTAILARGEPS
jgi:hypothetical protein